VNAVVNAVVTADLFVKEERKRKTSREETFASGKDAKKSCLSFSSSCRNPAADLQAAKLTTTGVEEGNPSFLVSNLWAKTTSNIES
jgi:hypothetical protein